MQWTVSFFPSFSPLSLSRSSSLFICFCRWRFPVPLMTAAGRKWEQKTWGHLYVPKLQTMIFTASMKTALNLSLTLWSSFSLIFSLAGLHPEHCRRSYSSYSQKHHWYFRQSRQKRWMEQQPQMLIRHCIFHGGITNFRLFVISLSLVSIDRWK